MEERDFFTEKQITKAARLACSFCGTENEYPLVWVLRTKKASLPPRADSVDRARFAKLQSYMVRRDDKVVCQNPRCRKPFEVVGIQTVVLL